jgi:hypothetical protein
MTLEVCVAANSTASSDLAEGNYFSKTLQTDCLANRLRDWCHVDGLVFWSTIRDKGSDSFFAREVAADSGFQNSDVVSSRQAALTAFEYGKPERRTECNCSAVHSVDQGGPSLLLSPRQKVCSKKLQTERLPSTRWVAQQHQHCKRWHVLHATGTGASTVGCRAGQLQQFRSKRGHPKMIRDREFPARFTDIFFPSLLNGHWLGSRPCSGVES